MNLVSLPGHILHSRHRRPGTHATHDSNGRFTHTHKAALAYASRPRPGTTSPHSEGSRRKCGILSRWRTLRAVTGARAGPVFEGVRIAGGPWPSPRVTWPSPRVTGLSPRVTWLTPRVAWPSPHVTWPSPHSRHVAVSVASRTPPGRSLLVARCSGEQSEV